MKVEIREDSVLITGYVNAVERYSKPITGLLKGVVATFIEKVKSGVFTRALKKNDDVKVLLNHDYDKELANTKDGSAKLYEDNIGLRAEVTIKDEDVIERAKNDELTGWSFGFYINDEEVGKEGNLNTRTINDLDLVEVSILTKGHTPAYSGTLIEAREDKQIEVRETMEDIEKEAQDKHEQVWEMTDELHKQINEEKERAKLGLFADVIIERLLTKFNITPKEEPPIENTRSIESYEERLKNL